MSTTTALRTQEDVQLFNTTYLEKLGSDGMTKKQAEDETTAYTRTKVREDGIWRRLMPVLPLTSWDRSPDTLKPIKVIDREGDSPAAISLPFGSLPTTVFIRGDRYVVSFDRILSPRFTQDVENLLTYTMDIRQILSDNAIKDMLAEEDGKFLGGVNTALVAPDTINPTSGTVQWKTLAGGITRDSLQDSFKVMPAGPSNLSVHTVLVNNLTILDICKFGRDEMGGDTAQDIMLKGWTLSEFMGKTWIITIKKALVPTGTMYHFADPKFIGKAYTLTDTTMYIRREAFMLEFFAYETIGGAIGHTGGLARVDFV